MNYLFTSHSSFLIITRKDKPDLKGQRLIVNYRIPIILSDLAVGGGGKGQLTIRSGAKVNVADDGRVGQGKGTPTIYFAVTG
jgi:hypothetical protein